MVFISAVLMAAALLTRCIQDKICLRRIMFGGRAVKKLLLIAAGVRERVQRVRLLYS